VPPDQDTHDLDALRAALARLSREPRLATAARYLAGHEDSIGRDMSEAVLRCVAAFSQSANPEVLPELAAHVSAHISELVRLTAGGAVGRFEFVRAHARRRAEQRFPLEATLHAYRCGHRVYSRWIRRALDSALGSSEAVARILGDITDFTIEYTDAVSTVLAAEYVAQTRLMADVAGDQRAQLMAILLQGPDESDGRVDQILREAGYLTRRMAFCAAVAQPVNAQEMANPARARRLADSVAALLAKTGQRQLVDVRDSEVVAVVSAVRRASGWTAPRSGLAEQVAAALQHAGNAVLIGVSNDAPSTAHLRRAHAEAGLCLRMASPRNRVLRFAAVGLRERMLHLCRDELAQLLPAWAQPLYDADDRSRGALVTTLRCYAASDMNLLRTARALNVHPNTLYARMDRIATITGLEPRAFGALNELLTVADCRDTSTTDRR
jgi:hypothetical protein